MLARLHYYLRLQPFDTDSPEGRAHERYRRALISGFASAAAKAVSVASMLITIPITLRYLGTESFGVWMTLSSFGALMAFTDFGLANGLMNAVAAASAKQDCRQVRILVSTGFAMLGTAALLLVEVRIVRQSTPVGRSTIDAVERHQRQGNQCRNGCLCRVFCFGNACSDHSACADGPSNGIRRQSLAAAFVCCGIDCHDHRSPPQGTACMACRGKLRHTDNC